MFLSYFRYFESLANKPGSRQGFHASAPALFISDDEDKEEAEETISSVPSKTKNHVRHYLDSIKRAESNNDTKTSLDKSSEFSPSFLNSKQLQLQQLYQTTSKIFSYAIGHESVIDLSPKHTLDLADAIDIDSVYSHYYDISISNPVFV